MEDMRKAVEMRMLGMTYEEIGAALGMTKAGAHALIRRAVINPPRKKVVFPNIARAMCERGLNQKELAALVGIEDQTISRILCGRNSTRLDTAFKIAAVLGMTVDEAFRKGE